jgi:murein DD-endopeptidase MepM/ murein hydrolase activator NlpD
VQGGLVFGAAPPGTTALMLDGAPVALAPDGRFMLGFGRDAAASATLAAITANGTITTTVDIAPRKFNIQSIPGLAKTPVPDAEFEARRPAELAAIAAARSGVTVAEGWSQDFVWPARGPVSGVFGSQRIYAGVAGSPHAGVDLAVPTGTPIHAPAAGVVRLAQGPFTLEGNLVMIDHGYGLISVFLHMSQIDVAVGQKVAQGDVIGRVGGTGRATGPHLHWGMTWGTGATLVRIDPQLLVPPQPATKPPA